MIKIWNQKVLIRLDDLRSRFTHTYSLALGSSHGMMVPTLATAPMPGKILQNYVPRSLSRSLRAVSEINKLRADEIYFDYDVVYATYTYR